MKRFGGLFLFLSACASVHAGEQVVDSTYRVIEVFGNAEGSLRGSSEWVRLKDGDRLPPGSRVRTGDDSTVDLSADVYYANLLHMGPGSRVQFLNAVPMRIALDHGSLFVLNEPSTNVNVTDEKQLPEVRILTWDFLASLRDGGCKVESTVKGAVVKAFSESVRVFPKMAGGYSEMPFEVEEGFRYTKRGWERMEYPDYMDWQIWYKKVHERQDSLR